MEKDNGKSIIESNDSDRWCSVSRKIAIRGKTLIDRKPPLLYPPTRSRNNRHHNIGIIATPPNVIVKEKTVGKKSRFMFLKKK